MARLVFDIETDGLLRDMTQVYTCVTLDIDTKEIKIYKRGDDSFVQDLLNAELLIGHNICGFDTLAIEQLYNVKFNIDKCFDTLLLSQLICGDRAGGHSLESYGYEVGNNKITWKIRAIVLGLIPENAPDEEAFKHFHEEMYDYCKSDVEINFMVYEKLLKFMPKNELFNQWLTNEQYVSRFCAMAERRGWDFDIQKALDLREELNKKLQDITLSLEDQLGSVIEPNDNPDNEYAKMVKRKANGELQGWICKWHNIPPDSNLIVGPFCRINIRKRSLGSAKDVKDYLFGLGWKPSVWNTKKVGKKFVKTSPKIIEEDLIMLGEKGKDYREYTMLRHRFGLVNGWIESCDEEHRVHGKCFTIGTQSFRSRHATIVNVPAPHSPYGKELRSLFIAPPGYKMVGCDSASNQARGLAFYLRSEEYTHILLEQDIHNFNKDNLQKICEENKWKIDVQRNQAKSFLYAFLFGAGGRKLSFILDDQNTQKIDGEKLKEGFLKYTPGFQNLIDSLNKAYEVNGGFIRSLCKNKIFVPSKHAVLVYLLQCLEKISCSSAVAYYMRKWDKDYLPCIFMHDEFQVAVKEEDAEASLNLGVEAFREGPKTFGIMIMDGDGKIGNNWEDTH